MLNVESTPSLRSPALLCGFSGWADAGFAASQALRYLLEKRDSQRLAEFDPDAIFSYTTTRPSAVFASPGQRVLRYPSLAWHALPVPEGPRDLVILVGPEPDLRWKACIDRAAEFMVELGVSQVITLGAFLAQVHYAAPAFMMGLAGTDELRHRLQELSIRETDYQGPTGFASGIAAAATGRDIPAASLWVAAPSYLPSMANPRLASALLSAAERLLHQDLWRSDLEAAGEQMVQQIEEAMQARPDLSQFLRQLAGQQTPEPPAQPHDESPEQVELPTAEEVLHNLEEHLRRLRRPGPDEPPPESQ